MGGGGTYRLAGRWPDLFARAFPIVGPPTSADAFRSLRNIPVMAWYAQSDELVGPEMSEEAFLNAQQAGIRYDHWVFTPAGHITLGNNDEFGPAAAFLGDHTVDRDPAHVTYTSTPAQDPKVAAPSDHAYWLSGLTRRATRRSGHDRRALARRAAAATRPCRRPALGAGTLDGGSHGPLPYHAARRSRGATRRPRPKANRARRRRRRTSARVTIDAAARRRRLRRRRARHQRRPAEGDDGRVRHRRHRGEGQLAGRLREPPLVRHPPRQAAARAPRALGARDRERPKRPDREGPGAADADLAEGPAKDTRAGADRVASLQRQARDDAAHVQDVRSAETELTAATRRPAAASPSSETFGSKCSALGSHQLRSPRSFIVAGSRTPRMSVASSRMAKARPTPICLNIIHESVPKIANTQTMTTAALVTTPAVLLIADGRRRPRCSCRGRRARGPG